MPWFPVRAMCNASHVLRRMSSDGNRETMTNDHLLQMRVSKEFLASLDAWRGTRTPIPARAQAIRELVERGQFYSSIVRQPTGEELKWAKDVAKRLKMK